MNATPALPPEDEDPGRYTEVRPYSLADPLRILEFDGRLLADVTTEDPGLPRWTTMDLYRTVDGRYVYHRVGHSLVYHALGSDLCHSGVETASEDLSEYAEPCGKCRPPMDPTEPVAMEKALHALFVCDDVQGVLQALVKVRNGMSTLSRPAQRLLDQAATHDPAFAGYRPIERL